MTAMRTAGHDTTVKIQPPSVPARLSHLKSPGAATAVAETLSQSLTISSMHRFPASTSSQYLIREEKP